MYTALQAGTPWCSFEPFVSDGCTVPLSTYPMVRGRGRHRSLYPSLAASSSETILRVGSSFLVDFMQSLSTNSDSPSVFYLACRICSTPLLIISGKTLKVRHCIAREILFLRICGSLCFLCNRLCSLSSSPLLGGFLCSIINLFCTTST